ncbi:MAG TPA: FAD-dependent oxidoreductase, partial [Anaerolineae bacterium]|nr:FAD-dependent oxidoreductase [Anaerolineae bacterium]
VETLAIPLPDLLPRSAKFVQAHITGFDLDQHVVKTDHGDFPYVRLIIALGSQSATYNIPGLNEHTLMLKSVQDARHIRGHFEIVLSGLKNRSSSMPYSIVIGGAGITGVELAAELSEGLAALLREYELGRDAVKVILIEASATVLPGFDHKTIDEAAQSLACLGVEVRTGTIVERVEANRVIVKPIGFAVLEEIETETLIWTGGIRANSLIAHSGLKIGERGAAIVDEYLHAIDQHEVYVLGDSAVVRDPRDGHIATPCGQLAVKQGQYAAKDILADVKGDIHRPYIPYMDGLLISLGSYAGVGTIGPVWVRRLIARLAKIGAETRYLYNVGGVRLVSSRWLGLRHEWVALNRGLRNLLGHRRSLRANHTAVK